jgi:O-antigen ligase/cytochrome c-type biogenesis protein CcmH/NrfG
MAQGQKSHNHRWTAWTLEASWLAAATLTPLVFNPWGMNAFELPKTALLQALTLLMGLAAAAQIIETRDDDKGGLLHYPLTPLLLPVSLLGTAYVLATIFSVSPQTSLWGSYERQQGLLTHSAYLALFLFAATHLRAHAQVERLWKALVWGSAPVVAYGLLQVVVPDPLGWQNTGASAVLSTIGRSNFLGSYLVLIVPLTAALITQARRRWPHALLLIGQLACLALTQARGAWVGMGAAIIASLLAWAITTRDRRPALVALAMMVLGVSFVGLLNLPNGPLAPLAQLPGLDRLASLSRTNAGSTAARLTIWRNTLPLILSRPWLGYGPETIRIVFARVSPPEMVFFEGRHIYIDRAHNLWLDLGMSAGLAGIVAFGAVLIGFARLAWRGLRQAHDRREQVVWIALIAAVVGHMVDMQFSFDLTASATIFWLTLAMGVAMRHVPSPHHPQPSQEHRKSLQSRKSPYLIPLTLAVLALINMLCLRPLLADVAYWRSQNLARTPKEQMEASMQTVRLWPLEPTYRLSLAWKLAQGGDIAKAHLAAADRLSPNDPAVWATLGDVYMLREEYRQAEEAYRKLVELSPNAARHHMALGLALVRQDRLEEGTAEMERAVALDNTDAAIYSHLADAYLALGRKDDAAQAQETYANLKKQFPGEQ